MRGQASGASPSQRPRKRFGQHFLRDPRQIERIIAAVAPRPGDHCVEIGPGDGALTLLLAKSGCRLDCIELDRDLAAQLESRFAEHERVRVHCRDVLDFDLATLARGGNGLRVIGNLPYNISTPVLFHVLKMSRHITDMTFMLQREVVDRMAAPPGNRAYGRLSVMLAYHCEVERLFDVAPQAFQPRPRVDSAVVGLRPHRPPPLPAFDESCLADVVRAAFGQRRKALRNSLGRLCGAELFAQAGVDGNARPEQLGIADFVNISNAIAAAREGRQA